MPDIINNVINNMPASGHNIYVCELAPFNQTGLYRQQWKSFGGFRIAKKLSGSRSHSWDLYLLSVSMLNNAALGDFRTKRFSENDYKPLYCSSFSDNAGSNVYSPIPNFSKLTQLNHPNFDQYRYSGNFSFNPILSTNFNEQWSAENIIYRASIYPLYPLLFCSSIPTHKSFGPAFLNSFEISVDGMDSLGDVEIRCSLTGGRSVISPDNVPPKRPNLGFDVIRMKNLDSSKEIIEYNNYQNKYRSINLSDCAFWPGLFTNFDEFRRTVNSSYNSNVMPPYKIVGMSLNISQQVNLVFTYPGYSVLSQIIHFGDTIGPRFAFLSDRTVTGTIKLFSPQNFSFINTNASSLTMFFGSAFYYTMKNVDWQQPSVTINPGNGFFIEYSFIARMTETTYFNGFNNSRVSEFL